MMALLLGSRQATLSDVRALSLATIVGFLGVYGRRTSMQPVDEILFEAWVLLHYEEPRDSLMVR